MLRLSRRLGVTLLATSAWLGAAAASPFVSPGDVVLRHDIQLLADHGVVTGPTTTWPLAWGPIMADIGRFRPADDTPGDVLDAVARIRARAGWETQTNEVYFNASASVAEKPTRIRSFENTPREQGEVGVGFTYTGNRFMASLNGQAVDSPQDDKDFRADGSVIGAMLGNYSFTVNTLERWWGPGWDGSLILSNNSRPIPAISVDRNFTDPFETKWLAWLGPWDFSVHFGQLESDRVVPDAQFFGMRFTFKPIPSLEIGLSRSAQWCGDGRPCDLEAFYNLLIGRDNVEVDVDLEEEPGNQLAGFDIRWATRVFDIPIALYGQFIGEDEAGGLPSRYLGQAGGETTGIWRDRWAYRLFGEVAATSCRFNSSKELFNCAYNHSIYQTGYRYRGRVIGHGAENDSRVLSIGLLLVDETETEWSAVLRYGELNRGGSPDAANTLTPTPQDIVSVDVRHARAFRFGEIGIGLGFEYVDDEASGTTDDSLRAFLEWRSSY